MPICRVLVSERGSTLIEVLIAVLVLSLGMLGMASLQTRGMQFAQSSLFQSQAAILAEDLLDRMRAVNDGSSTINQFHHGMNDSVPSSYTSCLGSSSVNCSHDNLAKYELYSWLEQVASILPNGKASIVRDDSGASPIYIVTIQYDDSRADSATSYGQSNTIAPKQFVFKTEL